MHNENRTGTHRPLGWDENTLSSHLNESLANLKVDSKISTGEIETLSLLIAKLEDSRQNLKRLHQISTKPYKSIDEMLSAYLEAGCELLQMEMGIVSYIQPQDRSYIVNNIYPEDQGISQGDMFELEDTYCNAVVDSGCTITFAEVGADEKMSQHPVYQNMGLEAYIGTPIIVDDELYGTLNFTDSTPRINQFGDLEVEFVEIMAQQIASAIHNERIVRHNKDMTTELANNEEILRMFVKHTPAAVAMFDTNMRYMLCSDRWKVDYELEGVELIGKSHYEIFPDVPDEWKDIHQRGLMGEHQKRDEDLFLREDGNKVWIKWDNRPWYRNGEIGGIIMFTEVITRRKEAEQALRHQKTLYEALVSHLPDTSTILFDTETRLSIANGPYLKKLGYDLDAIIGHRLAEVVSSTVRKVLQPLYERVLKGETIELEQKANDGSFYDARLVPVYDDQGQISHGLITVQDITIRKEAELALQTLNDKLVRMNEEVQQFAYIVSHDMRAPLVNLKGFSNILLEAGESLQELLASHEFEDDVQKEELEQILNDRIPTAVQFIISSVERMDNFSQAILELSRIERRTLQYKEIDINTILVRILASLGHELEHKSIYISIGDLPTIYGDEIALDQIFGNIISNAIKYFPADRSGKITIEAKEIDDQITFSIADNGRGIPERDYDKVFAPFRRIGKQTTEGDGMGLAYVQAQVRRHGGDIWFESEEDKGTTFYITLPKIKPESSPLS